VIEMKDSTIQWDVERVEILIEDARRAGRTAATARMLALQTAGPKWNVIDETFGHHLDEQGKQKAGWQMLDVCGDAHIAIANRRGSFWRSLLALGKERSERIYVSREGWLEIFDMTGRQEMSVNEAAHEAAAIVLRNAGIACSVHTRID